MADTSCPNCGEVGARHFVPPSLEEPAFYTCQPATAYLGGPSRPARDGETLDDKILQRARQIVAGSVPADGVLRLNVNLTLDMEQLATWNPATLRAFLLGMASVISATRGF